MRISKKSLTHSALVAVCSVVLVSCGGSSSSGTQVINGITVPTAPDPIANNATLAGIDSNKNGVRDDVEIVAAKNFGSNPDNYKNAMTHAKLEQSLITEKNTTSTTSYIKSTNCNPLSAKDLNTLTSTLLNTQERRESYASLLAGKSGSISGC